MEDEQVNVKIVAVGSCAWQFILVPDTHVLVFIIIGFSREMLADAD